MLPQSKQQSLLGGCGDQGQARCLLKVPQYGRVRQDSYLVWLAHSAVCAILDPKQGTLSLSTRLQPLNLLCQLWELSGQGSWKSSTGDSQTPSSQLVNRDTVTVSWPASPYFQLRGSCPSRKHMEVQIHAGVGKLSGGTVGPDLRTLGANDPLAPSMDLRSPNPSSCWMSVCSPKPENGCTSKQEDV